MTRAACSGCSCGTAAAPHTLVSAGGCPSCGWLQAVLGRLWAGSDVPLQAVLCLAGSDAPACLCHLHTAQITSRAALPPSHPLRFQSPAPSRSVGWLVGGWVGRAGGLSAVEWCFWRGRTSAAAPAAGASGDALVAAPTLRPLPPLTSPGRCLAPRTTRCTTTPHPGPWWTLTSSKSSKTLGEQLEWG